nr:MAG: hypothetical protein [uncultured archaeon]
MNCPKCKGKMNIMYEGATYTLHKCLCGFEQISYRGDKLDDLKLTIGLAINNINENKAKIEALESEINYLRDSLIEHFGLKISKMNIKYPLKNQKEEKQLEGNIEYYDEKTLTHFISDIEDWIKTQKFECQIDDLMFDVIDIGKLEQFLIEREKQMKRYNEVITKKRLEGKQCN